MILRAARACVVRFEVCMCVYGKLAAVHVSVCARTHAKKGIFPMG